MKSRPGCCPMLPIFISIWCHAHGRIQQNLYVGTGAKEYAYKVLSNHVAIFTQVAEWPNRFPFWSFTYITLYLSWIVLGEINNS